MIIKHPSTLHMIQYNMIKQSMWRLIDTLSRTISSPVVFAFLLFRRRIDIFTKGLSSAHFSYIVEKLRMLEYIFTA